MADIPQDILKAAEDALDKLLCNCVESCGGAEGLRKAAISDIAEAILAERERIKAMVKTLRDKHSSPTGNKYDCGVWDQSQRIIFKIVEPS